MCLHIRKYKVIKKTGVPGDIFSAGREGRSNFPMSGESVVVFTPVFSS